jgi:hypothetical protein
MGTTCLRLPYSPYAAQIAYSRVAHTPRQGVATTGTATGGSKQPHTIHEPAAHPSPATSSPYSNTSCGRNMGPEGVPYAGAAGAATCVAPTTWVPCWDAGRAYRAGPPYSTQAAFEAAFDAGQQLTSNSCTRLMLFAPCLAHTWCGTWFACLGLLIWTFLDFDQITDHVGSSCCSTAGKLLP